MIAINNIPLDPDSDSGESKEITQRSSTMQDTSSALVAYEPVTNEVVLRVEQRERFRQHATNAKAANTLSAYQTQIGVFNTWCDQHKIAPEERFPTQPHWLAAFLDDRASGRIKRDGNRNFPPASRSTLSIALAALKWAHERQRLAFDAANDPDFKAVWSGMRRGRLTDDGQHIPHAPQKQAAPLRGTELADVLNSMKTSLLDRRDGALLSLGYIAALRRSELVQIDWQKTAGGLGLLTLESDILTVTLYRSKTSQGDEVKILIDRNLNPKAVAAIENWVHLARIEPGTPLFRAITPKKTVSPNRLSDDGAHRALRSCMYRYHLKQKLDDGIEKDLAKAQAKEIAKAYSGHSPRVGFVTAAAEGGAQAIDIMSRTRHKSIAMINRYSSQADSLRRGRALDEKPGVGL